MSHKRNVLLLKHQWMIYGFVVSFFGVSFVFADVVFAADLNYNADTPITVGGYNLVIRSGSKAASLTIEAARLTVVAGGDTFTLVSTERNGFSTIPSIEGSCTSVENAITFSGTTIITPQGTVCQKNAGGVAVAPLTSSTQVKTPTPTSETTKSTTETSKPSTETAKSADKTKSAEEPKAKSPASSASMVAKTAIRETAEIKTESVALATISKTATVGTEEREILDEAKAAGIRLTTTSTGKTVEIPVAQKLLIVNLLTKDTESTKTLDFDERVDLLKQTAYFNDGQLPKNKADVAEVLKLARNLPLTDKEISKNALAGIKRNENAFCNPKTCKGFKDFDKYMRGVEPMKGDDAEAREAKGIKLFKKNVKRAPDMSNPLHQNLVDAFAYADLSIKKSPSKAKTKKK